MKRSLGRGRFLVAIGSVIALVGMALPWVTVGEGLFLTPIRQNGFDGTGILVFVAAVLLLALVTLPYASKTGTSSLDRAWSYVALAGLGVIALVIQVVGFLGRGQLGFPDRAPGLWIATAGTIALSRAVYDIANEPNRY